MTVKNAFIVLVSWVVIFTLAFQHRSELLGKFVILLTAVNLFGLLMLNIYEARSEKHRKEVLDELNKQAKDNGKLS